MWLIKDFELINFFGFCVVEVFICLIFIVVVGDFVFYGFDMCKCVFVFIVCLEKFVVDDVFMILFLFDYYFFKGYCEVVVFFGKWEISLDESEGVLL